MIGLEDGMLLYHGSYVSIPDIDLNRCMGGLDFGRGFYLTSSYEQAYNYVQLSVRKAKHIGAVPKTLIQLMDKYPSTNFTMTQTFSLTFSRTQYRMAAFCSGQSKERPLSSASEKIQRN